MQSVKNVDTYGFIAGAIRKPHCFDVVAKQYINCICERPKVIDNSKPLNICIKVQLLRFYFMYVFVCVLVVWVYVYLCAHGSQKRMLSVFFHPTALIPLGVKSLHECGAHVSMERLESSKLKQPSHLHSHRGWDYRCMENSQLVVWVLGSKFWSSWWQSKWPSPWGHLQLGFNCCPCRIK